MVKNLPASAGGTRDGGSKPGSGETPVGGHGNPLQDSCLENPMVRGDWRVTIHKLAKSQTPLKRLSTHANCIRTGFLAKLRSVSIDLFLLFKENANF